jgi:hypothetical protein
MSKALIEGEISAAGYLHVMHGMQIVDGIHHSLYDIVISPKDERGTVAFTLPQGITATIEVYAAKNTPMLMSKVVTIPRRAKILLAELLK